MGEGTRLDDLRRWKKGHYVNKQPTGVYLKDASEFNVKVMNGPSNNEGYVYYFEKPIVKDLHLDLFQDQNLW